MTDWKARGIGSFFETPASDETKASTSVPWEDGTSVSYMQTGRQAIAAIAVEYSSEGRNILIAPEYLCESMLEGFDPQCWRLETYRIAEDLTIDSNDLIDKITDPYKTVVLSATYFGNEPSLQHVSAIKSLRRQGVRVIEDETHRVLGNLEPVGDVAIASLRKVLPVADGAYIRGGLAVTAEVDRPHDGWQAMDEKAKGDLLKARKTFSQANADLTSWVYPPVRMQPRSVNMLTLLDYETLRRRRRSNAELLRQMLKEVPGLEVVNKAAIPSHLVVRVSQPTRIQTSLANVGIFCPIHWPRPAQLREHRWRNDLLSLPIDQRYDANDMQRIAAELKRVVAQ